MVTAALVPTSCATRRNAMAATPSSKAELLGSEQRLPSSFTSLACAHRQTSAGVRSGASRRTAGRGGRGVP